LFYQGQDKYKAGIQAGGVQRGDTINAFSEAGAMDEFLGVSDTISEFKKELLKGFRTGIIV